MDKILLHGAEFRGHHGVSEEERRVLRRYLVDVEVMRDVAQAGASDQLDDTISYADVYEVVRELVEKRSFHLVEALAETIATHILARLPAQGVLVRVKKSSPPLAGIVEYAGVEIFRERAARTAK